jgi:hypothetical protein
VDKSHPAAKVDFSFPPPKKYNYSNGSARFTNRKSTGTVIVSAFVKNIKPT